MTDIPGNTDAFIRSKFIKIIKLTMQIGKADLDRKMKQAQGFLEAGQQVQIQVFLKGRQRANPDRAVDFLENVGRDWLEDFGKQANSASPQRLSITYNPRKR